MHNGDKYTQVCSVTRVTSSGKVSTWTPFDFCKFVCLTNRVTSALFFLPFVSFSVYHCHPHFTLRHSVSSCSSSLQALDPRRVAPSSVMALTAKEKFVRYDVLRCLIPLLFHFIPNPFRTYYVLTSVSLADVSLRKVC